MRNWKIIGLGAMLASGMVGVANATPVSFDLAGGPETSVTVSDSAPLATLTGTLASDLDSQVFTLNDGETRTVDFFTLTARGLALGASYNVAATLAFDLPDIDAAGAGDGNFFTIFGVLSGGTLDWDDSTLPDYFTAGGNTLKVDFEDGRTILLGDTVMIHAYITNQGGGTAPVPEPGTMLLMGSGLIGLAGACRRARKDK